MRAKFGLFALFIGGLLMAAVSSASAQDRTTGAVKGVITDQATGDPVAGATVVITGPTLQGSQAHITEGDGAYEITNLPPGTYLITVYYSQAEFSRPNALVRLGKVSQVNIAINTQAGKGEIIQIEGRAPIIDQGSTKTGRTITPDYTQNIPTGRTFGGVLGSVAGSQGDLYGVSFAGSTSAENIYIVEGLNTTDPAFGLQSTNLPNEFIQETEVISGGYNAEYGRSTGGVVNVLTKSGSNEFHGSAFTYFTPGQFTAAEVETPRAGTSIDRNNQLAYSWDVGAEIGGPIIKDKLWFHAGFNPSFSKTDVHRIIKTRIDEDGDMVPDRDANGFIMLEEVDRETLETTSQTRYFTGKLTGAVSPDHQGSLSFLGNPAKGDSFATVTGIPEAGLVDVEDGAWDLSAKWTSKLLDNKTQIDAVLGFHRNVRKVYPQTDLGDTPQIRWDPFVPLTNWAEEEMVYGGVPLECEDDTENDPYPTITNCPVNFYNLAGVGFRETQVTDRLSVLTSLTQRVKFAGHHTFKAGIDFEDQVYDHISDFTGGTRYRRRSGFWQLDRWYSVRDDGMDICDIGGVPTPCVHQDEGLPANTSTRNLGFYVQDSWALLPNLTLNAGIRYEQQTLFVADEVKDVLADDVAFKLSNMLAPRLGVIYDPTQEGRAKLIGHWGRFYESIPMDINARAFGGEVFGIRLLSTDACPADVVPDGFMCDESSPLADFFLGGGEEAVAPGLKGQFIDEWVIGGEYELFNDFKLGANLVHRALGRAIEDISTDGGTTYIIANPGEVDEDAIQDLRDQGMDELADQFAAAGEYDSPTRGYNALQLTAEKRFTKELMMQASYTYSSLEGNFPGLFSPETGQLDPNLTSMYDLPELMANRSGPLAADRPHLFKLDGYYQLDAKEIGMFVFGASVRASSGVPHNALGAHIAYGLGETYILPRGTWDRSPFSTRFDIQVAYGRRMSKDVRIDGFLRVFNVFNQQPGVDVDENYTYDVVHPCVGCDEEDLAHVKVVGENDDGTLSDSALTPEVNPNFGNVNDRQDPASVTLGVRVTF